MKTFPKPLTPGEERACLERCKEGDQEARNELIERNMRLVAHVAKKYQNTDYDMEDLLSVGTIGLIKAVNTFHADRGSRLATYAAKCIENAILTQMLLWRRRRFADFLCGIGNHVIQQCFFLLRRTNHSLNVADDQIRVDNRHIFSQFVFSRFGFWMMYYYIDRNILSHIAHPLF